MKQRLASLALAAVAVGLALWIPTSASDPMIGYCIDALMLMTAAMSLNLLLGYTGQISIGHSDSGVLSTVMKFEASVEPSTTSTCIVCSDDEAFGACAFAVCP